MSKIVTSPSGGEWKAIPDFKKYLMDARAAVVRAKDFSPCFSTQDNKMRIYDDAGKQRTINTLEVCEKLWGVKHAPSDNERGNSTVAKPAKVKKAAAAKTATAKPQAAAKPAKEPEADTAPKEKAAPKSKGSGWEQNAELKAKVEGIVALPIVKHFRAHLLEQEGLTRGEIADLLFSGNHGASRNACIAYVEDKTLAKKMADKLATATEKATTT